MDIGQGQIAGERVRRAGRPTRQEAQRRDEHLLDGALDLFLEHGFELTTIDAICARAGTTKRTVYARFDDKAALFRAAVERAVAQWNMPVETLGLSDEDSLEHVLTAVARLRVQAALRPEGLKLLRLLSAQASRFPDMFQHSYRQGTLPAMQYLAALLARRGARGEILADDPERLASSFLSLAIGGTTRGAVLGLPIDTDIAEAQIHFAVRVFLKGVEPR